METEGDAISTSVGTIRGLPFTSITTQPRIHTTEIMDSIPPSPSLSHDLEHEHDRDSLASAPDSPASSSSFPSLSSSVFLSSAADGRTGNNSPETHAHDAAAATSGLIIPSLTLPPTLRTPTTYGQSVGALRLLVVGRNGVGKSLLSNILLDRNEDIVDIGEWEPMNDRGRILLASTYWIEHKDEHGLEHFEPARNVEIVEIAGYEDTDDATATVETALGLVTQPFTTVLELLDPNAASPVLADLISSPTTPLFTALILLLSDVPSPLEQALLNRLSPLIPLIPLPAISHFSSPTPSTSTSYRTSRFSPETALGLRAGLFRTPDTLASLRSEATTRFLEWREARTPSTVIAQPERARPRRTTVSAGSGLRPSHRRMDTRRQSHYTRPKLISRPSNNTQNDKIPYARSHSGVLLPATTPAANAKWDKAAWEAEWAASTHPGSPSLSRSPTRRRRDCAARPSGAGADPLHLPSLLAMSIALLGPLKDRLAQAFGLGTRSREAGLGAAGGPGGKGEGRGRSRWRVGFAVLGAFCVGIGVGLVVRARGTW